MGSCSLALDCVKVTSELFAGIITLGVAAFSVWLAYQYQKERDSKRQTLEDGRRRRFDRKLARLGEARGGAIEIRNFGERNNLTGKALKDWIKSAKAAEKAMIESASKVSKAVGSLVDWQDRVQVLIYPDIKDSDQQKMPQNLSGAIIKAETVIVMSYRR